MNPQRPDAEERLVMKPGDKARSIARNTSVLTFAQLSATLISFLLTPYILRKLGVDLFGLWAFVGSIAAFASLLNLSLGRSSIRFMSVHAEHGENDVVRRIVSYGALSHLVIGLALTPVVWLLGTLLIPHTTIAAGDVDLAENLLLLAFLGVVFAATVRPIGNLLIALERIWLTSLIVLASQLVYAATIIGLLAAGAGVYGVAFAMLLQTGVQGLFYYVAARRIVGRVFGNPFKLERPLLRQMLGFSAWTQVVSVASVVNRQTDAIVIGAWVNVGTVGLYDVGNRIAQQTRTLPLTMLTPLLPATAGVHAQGDTKRLARMVLQASRAIGLLTLAFAGLLIAAAPLVMRVWLGRSYPDVVPITVLLVITYAVNNLTGVGTTVVSAIGKPVYEAEYGVAGVILNVVLTVSLAPFFGLWGILAGTVIGVVSTSLWFLWRFHQVMGLSLWVYLGAWLWKLGLATVVAACVVRAALAAIPGALDSGRLAGALLLVALSVLYLAVLVAALAAVRFFGARDLELIRRLLPRPLQPLVRGTAVDFLFGART
jgi:O-antigen/teichoic acid export membrane protein